jgi:hypothetical protein
VTHGLHRAAVVQTEHAHEAGPADTVGVGAHLDGKILGSGQGYKIQNISGR